MANDAVTGPLDNPIWLALTTGNRAFAEGGPLALRYPSAVAPFAAIADRSAAAFAELATLVPEGGRLALFTVDRLGPPDLLVVDMQAPIIQMVLDRPMVNPQPGPAHVELVEADGAAMLDLAGRTRPGPFGPRTIELGHYIGIRADGALVAMAGERMHCGGFVEISAVCVDPDHRGRGYAGMLVTRLATRLQGQGLTPFLHVFASNAGAIALYEKLGFVTRRLLHVTSFRHAPANAANSGAA
jgi:ribosomal protein S18 acetylase RimI-like enzyme